MSHGKKRRFDSGKKITRGGQPLKPSPPESAPECFICNKKIQDLALAVVDNKENKPAHFDCVVSKITTEENLSPMEKIIYIGSGNFAVVNALAYRNNKVEIIRKINYESHETKNNSVLNQLSVEID